MARRTAARHCTSAQPVGSKNPPISELEDIMRRKGVDAAWNRLEHMQRHGLHADKFTVSRMLMKTAGNVRGMSNLTGVYRGISLAERFVQMQPSEADEMLLNALLDTCCRLKDVGRLESVMQLMRSLNVRQSHVTLGILVKAYGQAGDVTRVLNVWDEMSEQRANANAVTYGCMIDACVKCGRLDKALLIFEDIKRQHKHRNTVLYTTLIKGFGLQNNLTRALQLFTEMRDEGVPCNTIAYNSIIAACVKCGNVNAAEDFMREMMAIGTDVCPDLITYSTILKGYCQFGELDKALQVSDTIKTCGITCDELVYNTLIDGCVKVSDLSAGIGLFAEMVQAGMRPSAITHSILVRLYQRNGCKNGAANLAVVQLYEHHGLEKPTRATGGKSGARGKDKRANLKLVAQSGMPGQGVASQLAQAIPSALEEPLISAVHGGIRTPHITTGGSPYLPNVLIDHTAVPGASFKDHVLMHSALGSQAEAFMVGHSQGLLHASAILNAFRPQVRIGGTSVLDNEL